MYGSESIRILHTHKLSVDAHLDPGIPGHCPGNRVVPGNKMASGLFTL